MVATMIGVPVINTTVTVVELLDRLGAQLVPADRVPGDIFATGRLFGSCPRCERWDSIHILADGSWRAACACWGRPWRRLDRIDALTAVLKTDAAS